MIDLEKLKELREQYCDHVGSCSEIPYCADSCQHLFDTIESLYKKLAESERLLSQCNTENKNVHAENVKLWKVAMAAKGIVILEVPFHPQDLKEALSDLGDLI